MKVHYTGKYLRAPEHLVTVDVVGVGGTGSQMLSGLARINMALLKLGHPGLNVRAWDPDTVEDGNIGRQLFSPADIGLSKSAVLISRINRAYGFEWNCETHSYDGRQRSNILITCVDTAAARIAIGERYMPTKATKANKERIEPYNAPYYWLDLGNMQHTGQVVLGTAGSIAQPKSNLYTTVSSLPPVTRMFNLKKIREKNQGPSCSLAEALTKQDLFINSTLAQFGCNLIWKLFREGMIKFHGCYLNLETFIVNPIKIK
jgi:PRTRC genetic system ThiF family protein